VRIQKLKTAYGKRKPAEIHGSAGFLFALRFGKAEGRNI